MSEATIICPNCKNKIKLTESLAAPLIEATREEYKRKLARQDADIAKREATLRDGQAEIAKLKESIEKEIAGKLKAERQKIAIDEAKKARLLLSTDIERKEKEIADLQDVLQERDAKLADAQNAQAELIRKQRELDDAKREFELTVEQKVQESLGSVRNKAKTEAEEGFKLKVAERDEQINSLQRQIEDLMRKAEQGSQQLQGEVQELALESILRAKFPGDDVEPVAKGEFGGDVLHRIIGPQGTCCGSILWESKRTKNWSESWLSKLREDQRAAKADMAIIVTRVLPDYIQTFGFVDGVWITEFRCLVPVVIAVRHTLIEVASARQSSEGQQTKMQMMYQYLIGPRFRHRVEAIVDKFTDMQDDLNRERKMMTRSWAKREEQIRGVIESTAGMYGDLQGIAGRHLQEIEGLDLPLLEAGDETTGEIP